jgi:hypothetical protein
METDKIHCKKGNTMKYINFLKFFLFFLVVIFLSLGITFGKDETFSLKEDLSIGEEYGDENLMFGRVSYIKLDSEENIYILDGKNFKIQVFDPQGGFLRSIHLEKGQGPKEISRLGGFAVHPDGMISIHDSGGRKIVNFNRQGTYQNYFKLNFQASDIEYYKNGNLVLLGFNRDKGIHVYNREGECLSSFVEPFPLPSKLSKFKDMPYCKFPIKLSSSGDGKIFLLNPHKYEILMYKDGQLSEKFRGKSEYFRPMMVQVSGKGENQGMSIIFPSASILEYKGRMIIVLRVFKKLGAREIESQMQIYEAQTLLDSLNVKGFLYTMDSKGRLYFSMHQNGFPVMKRFILEASDNS